VPEPDKSMFDEFAAWLESKRAAEAENDDGDEEVEIWNKEGAGARVKKRDAAPFLKSLGLLPDPEPESTEDDKGKDKGKSRPTGRTSATATGSQSTVRKYFSKPS
jgi:hypothetical protein